jgi:hypothetical protein
MMAKTVTAEAPLIVIKPPERVTVFDMLGPESARNILDHRSSVNSGRQRFNSSGTTQTV